MRPAFLHVSVWIACGGPSPTPPATPPSAPPAPIPSPAPPTPTARPACSDGGDFFGAALDATGARYCVDQTCWRLDATSGAFSAISADDARAVAGEVVVPRDAYGETPPDDAAKPRFSVTIGEDNRSLSVCDRGACTAFPVPIVKPKVDAWENDIGHADISESGTRIAVSRGLDGMTNGFVELYDRDSRRRLAIVRAKFGCAELSGFAGDALVVQDWDCANQGGPRIVTSPDGKVTTKIDSNFARASRFFHVDGDRWGFVSSSFGEVVIADIAKGSTIATIELQQGVRAGGANGRVFGFDPDGIVSVFDRDGKRISRGRPLACTWMWIEEEVAGIRLRMTGRDAIKVHGAPSTARLPENHAKLSFRDGLSVTVQNYQDFRGRQSSFVTAIDVVAPSAATTTAGIHVGSTAGEVETAYGAHAVPGRSTGPGPVVHDPTGSGRSPDAMRVFANPGDAQGGISIALADGRVTAIHIEQ